MKKNSMHNYRMVMLSSIDGLSGIHTPILHEIKKKWDVTAIIDPFKISFFRNLFLLVISYSLRINEWKKKYHFNKSIYMRSPYAFLKRTRYCEKQINKLKNQFDVIFQLSSMFSASTKRLNVPYFIYVDRTTKMNERYFPESLKFKNKKENVQWNTLMRNCFQKADIIFTFNDMTKTSIINDYLVHEGKILTVNSGVNIKIAEGVAIKKENLIMAVCSDYERHCGEICIDAFKNIMKDLPGVMCVYVGNIYGDKNIGDVKNIDKLSLDELSLYYSRAKIVVMPAFLGGMQTITEAMGHKCICIARESNPYIKNLIVNGENGYLIATEDTKEIEYIIKKVIGEGNPRIKENAYATINLNYTWDRVVEKMDFYMRKKLNYDRQG